MMERNAIQHSGFGGSKVLVSEGADQFDPDSLLEEEVTLTTKSLAGELPLAILKVSPPHSLDEFEIGGFFDGLSSEQGSLSLELTGLLPVALELSHLALMEDRTNLVSVQIRGVGPEPSNLELPGFQLVSVQIGTPLSNRVKIKVLFNSYEHN